MTIEIRLLGGFEVEVDGSAVPPTAWQRRAAADLVKLLALAPARTLHRERVLDALWPGVAVDEAAPRLHKAAHYARRALGRDDAVVLRADSVALLPGVDVAVDLEAFERLAREAERRADAVGAERALAVATGDLLPEDPYEAWAEAARAHVTARRAELLRQSGRWAELLELDPADEEAHVGLMREHARRGDRRAALRQYERLDRALRQELGLAPGPAAVELRDHLLAASDPDAPEEDDDLVGRDGECALLDEVIRRAAAGEGRAALLTGPPGSGKSALLVRTVHAAQRRGWRSGRGSASRIEGAWPYAPVLEALADLCREHPALLDGLADEHRSEIERALALRDVATPEDGGHQRLFIAAAELLRLAAAGEGALLVVDDVHDGDDASLRLLHHLARASARARVVVLLAYRSGPLPAALADVRTSLLDRRTAVELALPPLDDAAVRDLVERHVRSPDDALIRSITTLSEGLPLAVVELARRAASAGGDVRPLMSVLTDQLPRRVREVLTRVAVSGIAFDTDEFVALAGLDENSAYDRLDEALAARAVVPGDSGYRFRHPLLRQALLDEIPEHRRRLLHRDAAARLASLGASPARIAHHLVAAGDPVGAAPHLLQAARAEAAVGAYHDALDLLDDAEEHPPDDVAAPIKVLRADMLTRLGDPRAVGAYRTAIRLADGDLRRHARTGLARAAIAAGDLETATAAIDGLTLDGGPGDGPLLLAQGNLAFFRGDVDSAAAIAQRARALLAEAEDSWELLDLVALQGLIAHQRGEWFSRLDSELRSAGHRMVTAVFDANLCVSEYLLYGPTPYPEVLRLAADIRRSAEKAGALRAVAFAASLTGEASLMSGDLEQAETALHEAVDLHAEAGARAGQAHSLQRLAEVRIARGDTRGARELLDRALPLARWTPVALHLLQRIYGSMIAAAPDPVSARDTVELAQATTDDRDACWFCSVMFEVPASIACADVGDLAAAREHLAGAERSTALWSGTAWQAATTEARAHIAAAEGDTTAAQRLLAEAAHAFQQAGHPLDVDRCRRTLLPLPSPRQRSHPSASATA